MAQRQTCSPMEQNRNPSDQANELKSISGENQAFSTKDAGKIASAHAEI